MRFHFFQSERGQVVELQLTSWPRRNGWVRQLGIAGENAALLPAEQPVLESFPAGRSHKAQSSEPAASRAGPRLPANLSCIPSEIRGKN